MTKRTLKSISSRRVQIFKIKNRCGFGALCLNHLTEGRTPLEAFDRMVKAVKRSGYDLQRKRHRYCSSYLLPL